jgi:hypothetical protein
MLPPENFACTEARGSNSRKIKISCSVPKQVPVPPKRSVREGPSSPNHETTTFAGPDVDIYIGRVPCIVCAEDLGNRALRHQLG